jgi:hypothetical protein
MNGNSCRGEAAQIEDYQLRLKYSHKYNPRSTHRVLRYHDYRTQLLVVRCPEAD